MTTEFLEGDLVEAVKGRRVVRDVVHASSSPIFTDGLYLGEPAMFGLSSLSSYYSSGFTLTLIERPKPKVELPTESGFYIDKAGDAWLLGSARKLQLLTNTWGTMPASESARDEYASMAEENAPFTRLESRADTAKAVIDAIRSVSRSDGGYYEHQLFERELRSIAAEFGVTND